ncbi:MAG: MBL fold metallo-hydrolase [Prolixibacteraceae bacterium]|jgi:glyoxylase-like metal-dependent hydrolase (beta-lactamase superfamily II)|nr:MBL fold metallo-hydrolase [Prolixibacteraceae bacterium]
MNVIQVINEVFTSNTYVISNDNSDWVWLIDIGNLIGVLNTLSEKQQVRGVFITHPHYDHIYSINQLIELYPDCQVFASAQTSEGLYSAKLNLSFYHDFPIEFKGTDIKVLNEGATIELFDKYYLEAMKTPGHHWGCLSFRINNYLFTGDSYIPNFEVVTKLKGGNKEAALESLDRLKKNIKQDTIICPGHGKMQTMHEFSNKDK